MALLTSYTHKNNYAETLGWSVLMNTIVQVDCDYSGRMKNLLLGGAAANLEAARYVTLASSPYVW